MLKALLESLDEKVFTPEVKQSLEETFNEAVELKAVEISSERIEEEIEKLSEQSDLYKAEIEKKAEEYLAEKELEMADNLDKYLERVVEEFVTDKSEKLEESTKNEKAELLIEAFDSILIAAGVDVARIAEAKQDTSTEVKLAESVTKQNELVEEILSLKEENDKLIKLGVISEMSEGLSLVEAQKFERLAALVEFSKSEAYAQKLETIKESVKGSKPKTEEQMNESSEETHSIPSHLV